MFGSLVPWREKFVAPNTGRFSRALDRMEDEMDDLMGRVMGHDGGWLRLPEGFVPSVDIAESEQDFAVTVDLPGLKPEEVQVEIKDGALWITGKKEESKEEKGKTYHRLERTHGEFRRVLPLPSTIDQDKVKAKFNRGVLTISVPKTADAQTKRIEVKS